MTEINHTSNIRKLIFRIIVILLPMVFLVLVELLFRVFNYGEKYSLFVQKPDKGYEDYLMVNYEIGKKYFSNFHYTTPPNDIFLRDKKDNTFRVFVMGSSTVYGFPYNRNLMFSRILYHRLRESYPNKNIEVINTAITAINSYTLLDYTDQIIEMQPDAVLIYAGHNEFYGAFGVGSNESVSKQRWLTLLHIKLLNFRLYQFLRSATELFVKKTPEKRTEKSTLMKEIVSNDQIMFKGKLYNDVMQNYLKNMDAIIGRFSKKKIPVFLSEVVSNDRDLAPFSSNTISEGDSALVFYKKAKEYQKNGDTLMAKEHFIKARNYDCVRFRASTEVNENLRGLAKKHRIKLVQMSQSFESNSPLQVIGDNLMIDHVHPNIDGQFLMAETFFQDVYNSKIVKSSNTGVLKGLKEFKNSYGYTELDSLVAYFSIEKLKSYWPFVRKNVSFYPSLHTTLDSLAFYVSDNKQVKIDMAREGLARQYLKDKDFDKAFIEYNAILYGNPYLAINYIDAAECLLLEDKYEKALSYFERSLAFDESHIIYFIIGELQLILDLPREAGKTFERYIEISPKDNPNIKFAKTFISLIHDDNVEYAKEVAVQLVKIR